MVSLTLDADDVRAAVGSISPESEQGALFIDSPKRVFQGIIRFYGATLRIVRSRHQPITLLVGLGTPGRHDLSVSGSFPRDFSRCRIPA